MVSLHKQGVEDKTYLLYIMDNEDNLDYVASKLTNRAMLDIIGKALKMGYTDFMVGISVMQMETPKDVQILRYSPGSDIWVNWDMVRKLDKSEWSDWK